MNSTKGVPELQQGISRVEHEELKEKDYRRTTTDLSRYRCTTLISNMKSTMIQVPKSEHAGSELSESNPTSI